jgi:hypothetical protein
MTATLSLLQQSGLERDLGRSIAGYIGAKLLVFQRACATASRNRGRCSGTDEYACWTAATVTRIM